MKYFYTGLIRILNITIFFIFFIRTPVHSADLLSKNFEANKIVSTDKIWNIKFNIPLNESTINKNNIYVYDNNFKYKNDIGLIYDNDKKIVQVIPKTDYEDNSTYYLHIKKGIQSLSGDSLKEEKVMEFRTNNKDQLKRVIKVNTEEELEKIFMQTIINRENNIVLDMESLGEGCKGIIEKVKNKVIKENPKLNYINNIRTFYTYDESMNVNLSKVYIYIDYLYFIDNSYLDYDFLGSIRCSLDKKVMLCGEIGKIQLQCLNEDENIKKISYLMDKPNIINVDSNGNVKAVGEGEVLIKVQYEKYSKNIEDNNVYEYFFYIPIKVIPQNSNIVRNKNELYNIVNESFGQGKDEVNIYIDNKFMNTYEIDQAVEDIFKEDYTGYYSIGSVNYDYTKIRITYPYNISKNQYLNMKRILDSKTEEVINKIIKKDMSDLEKEYAIHDYIVSNTVYDYDNFIKGTVPNEGYYPYGILINGKGVCNGYALTMKLLLNKVGIECEKVDGRSKEGEHAWNIVKINNNYYHVDTTWDDPIPDDNTKISYQYFNMTDDEMSYDHDWNKSMYNLCNNDDFKFLRK